MKLRIDYAKKPIGRALEKPIHYFFERPSFLKFVESIAEAIILESIFNLSKV